MFQGANNMLNIIFVSDDTDIKIGTNCSLSHKHLNEAVSLVEDNVILLNGDLCTADELQKAITSFEGKPCILVAFSHGTDDALLSKDEMERYLHKANAYYCNSSLVYTNSCYSGVVLMQDLIDEKCAGFVGYDDEVRLPENEEDDILFIECENSGLIHFLQTQDSLTQSVEVMKNKYREQYDNFLSKEMNVAAAVLFHNLNSLTFYDGNITRQNFEN